MSARFNALLLALGLFLLWTAATYWLEGRIHTLLRPDAALDRLLYALVANLLIGIGGAVLVLRQALRWKVTTLAESGFRSGWRIAAGVLAGTLLGSLFFLRQRPPTLHPMVLINAFAQVLVVTVAEVLVCWAVVGSLTATALRPRGRWIARIAGVLVASALFGIYHFAHSPPFNQPPMVLLLTVVGVLTSLFFFASGEVYGTIVFHNFLGVFGVLQALVAAGRLAAFEQPQIPLLGTAALSLLLLAVAHVLWLRPAFGASPTG